MQPRKVCVGMAAIGLCALAMTALVAEPAARTASASPTLLKAQPAVRLLFPANHVLVEADAFEVIAVVPDDMEQGGVTMTLRVDGQVQSWEPAAPPARVARIRLASGRHTLSIGDDEIFFFVAAADTEAPRDWPTFRRHPLLREKTTRCGECHAGAAQDPIPTYAPPAPGEACGNCHNAENFAVTHEHIEPPLRNCAMCHAVHGALHDALLKAPAKKLCVQCHD